MKYLCEMNMIDVADCSHCCKGTFIIEFMVLKIFITALRCLYIAKLYKEFNPLKPDVWERSVGPGPALQSH